MPLDSADIKFCYTGEATGPTNNTLSLGGTISGSPPNTIPDTVNNIFDDVTGDESESGDTEYRGIAIYIDTISSSGSFDLIRPRIWISGYSTDAPDTISIAPSTFGLNADTMGVCANESSAPDEDLSGLWVEEGSGSTIYFNSDGSPTLTKPATEGTLSSEHWVGLWLRRVVPESASAYNNRVCTITVQGETSASPYKSIVKKIWIIQWNRDRISVF